MRIELLDEAEKDLLEAYHFYEKQTPSLGHYFLDTLFSEIDSLLLYAGIHAETNGYHRMLSRRFPYAVYYRMTKNRVQVYAVLDCRKSPKRTQRRLRMK
ncbi:MAG: type II toxin-antitoxin system RelE/ParE family toxin [Gammaproteobacteria bacterium]|nr:type II toxin-antitoxin system RelE/ParE family toxin [Gammaproteobacteria bacterium]MCW8958123.1 type II toxin-antitoxin system RelE/ParE family toxin [Gammaproteobacteria bacterium]MCW8973696.1 type II toxin-antitoxin system RelE/ParE family toxin [Gammaproteobacteria bacterium]MCW8993560.1 type II toxin-antitoxin system RelE/ParE family toxin [Gammaproteobacteria bacterium]